MEPKLGEIVLYHDLPAPAAAIVVCTPSSWLPGHEDPAVPLPEEALQGREQPAGGEWVANPVPQPEPGCLHLYVLTPSGAHIALNVPPSPRERAGVYWSKA